ncbi:IPT/TIG domain-containing protein [Pontibacter silvestris]|uniref:IPT/TIG domain-containing protein n=1 Tax=Pontibacter silvestris TaxID=2305183 RepID=A0ABW4WWK7_9BACT|nr:IPT/TIG domain-containing protein [Pontibacter silvestris]MCC9137596.1 IPT/TIG domain-containing protein [Pontibacter silvestris]
MKNIYNVRLLLLVCLILSFGFLTSCEDDDDTQPNAGQVQLLSFGPTGVQHGEEIRFIGHNLNQVEAVELPSATVAKADFLEQTSELIRLIVPDEAMEGLVTLKLSDGKEITSKTVLSFEVPITISSVTTEARPGTNITINGTKLNWVEGVVFAKDTVDEFVSQSATELVLQVPLNAKTGTLVLIGGGTEPSFVETEEELIVTLPKVTSLSPAAVKHSESLTLTGTDLDLVQEVVFAGGAIVSDFTSQSATEIVLTVPNTADAGALTLVAAGSLVEVVIEAELELTLPTVTSMNAVKHGDNLTITGTNLDMVKEVVFAGGAKVSAFVSRSASQLEVKVPDTADEGNLTLITTHGYEVPTSSALDLILPAVTSATPTPVDPGANVTITGSNLDLVKSVVFGGDASVSTFVNKSANQIVVTVPDQATSGTLTLITTHNYEVATETEVTVVLPVVTGITPAPAAYGAYLTITGTNLDLVQSVKFTGGATVTNFLAKTASQIILTVPAEAKSGTLTLVTNRGLEIETTLEAMVGDGGPDIDHFIYDNALNADPNNGWTLLGGWGKASEDLANTEQVSRGEKSIKVVYNEAYGAFHLSPKNPNILNDYTHVVLYVYGGSGNNRMALRVKTKGGVDSPEPTFELIEGEWQKVEIPISAFGDISGGISEFMIKNYGTESNTIYIDDVGLRD